MDGRGDSRLQPKPEWWYKNVEEAAVVSHMSSGITKVVFYDKEQRERFPDRYRLGRECVPNEK